MIVPISSAASPFADVNAGPSDTNLLMALAEMHRQGRFDNADVPDPARSHHSPIEKEMKNG